jgi:putative membrane protein
MAWIRTSLSTISFGFTIYKILLSAMSEKLVMVQAQSPKRIGLFLISLGTMAMILGTVEYYQTMKHLDKMTARVYKPFNFSTVVGCLVGPLGLFLVITILLNDEVF